MMTNLMKTKWTPCLIGAIQSIDGNSFLLKRTVLLVLHFVLIMGISITLDAQDNSDKNISSISDTIRIENKELNLAQIDSLKKLPIDSLHVWIDDMSGTNIKEFPIVAHFALEQALKKNDYESAASMHDAISYWNYTNYEINGADTIIYHRKKQIEYSEKTGNLSQVGEGYYGLAIDYMDSRQYTKGQVPFYYLSKFHQVL